jgi:hypothetical protein
MKKLTFFMTQCHLSRNSDATTIEFSPLPEAFGPKKPPVVAQCECLYSRNH